MSSAMSIRNHAQVLGQAIEDALTALGTGAPGDPADQPLHALETLRTALSLVHTELGELPPPPVLPYVQAACRHLGYGELMEARMLLTSARRHVQPPVTATALTTIR